MSEKSESYTTPTQPRSIGPREGLIPWLRRVIAGNPPVDAEIVRLRQELEWANARADMAERDTVRVDHHSRRVFIPEGYAASREECANAK